MSMDPTERVLELLSLLQSRRQWSAAELADRFGVTPRTVRRDVDRLRVLGYPVDATTGRAGGYRLASGAHLPPLVFDDEEAVALVLGLRRAADAAISGIADASVRSLVKVEQSLPDHLRRRVAAIDQGLVSLRSSRHDDRVVDPEALALLAATARDLEEVRFEYRDRVGDDESRLVEPHQLLSAGRLWYLVAWDLRRSDWRIFRLDRLHDVRRAGRRFVARDIPGGDAAVFLERSVGSLSRPVEAVVDVAAPHGAIEVALERIDHVVVETTADSCRIRFRGDRLDGVALDIVRVALVADVEVVQPGDLRDQLTRLSRRLGSS